MLAKQQPLPVLAVTQLSESVRGAPRASVKVTYDDLIVARYYTLSHIVHE